jgi:hypothetical protein
MPTPKAGRSTYPNEPPRTKTTQTLRNTGEKDASLLSIAPQLVSLHDSSHASTAATVAEPLLPGTIRNSRAGGTRRAILTESRRRPQCQQTKQPQR